MKPDSCTNYSASQQSNYNNVSSNGSNRIRVIRLRRRSNVPLGFSVRGGREHGTGIFVSEVRAGSEAHHQGLLVGDQILRINGFNIEHAIHDEVLALLRAKPGVVIKVKSMGMIPVKDTKKDPLTWKIVEPGPSSIEYNGTNGRNSTDTEGLESRISIPSIGSSGLGCSIVKGPPDIPGIYIQSVKSGSLAEKAGLQVGDQILEMNGHNFTNLDFPGAVAILKSSKQMTLVLLKGVGLDLFPDEKLRRSSHLTRQDEHRKLSSVQEEDDSRDERNAKRMNGHNPRVKNGSDPKHQKEGDLKLNGNSTCSDSDVSTRQLSLIQDGVSLRKHGHSVEVHATVHSSSGDDDSHSYVRKCTRESGDGMDFESLNGNRHLRSFASWDDLKYAADHKSVAESSELGSQSHDASWEEESCSSSHSSGREGFKSNVVNGRVHSDVVSNGQVDKTSVTSDEKSELSSLSSDDYLGIPKIPTRLDKNAYETSVDDCIKPPNEFLKRKQHELLMEEFREVHKKMFGHGPPRQAKAQKPTGIDLQDQSSLYKRRQQVRKDRITPPPPPPTDANGPVEQPEIYECLPGELEEKFCDMDEKIAYRRRQREPPITDSRDLDPKPPQIYFDRPEGGPKPLVTIGTYSNATPQNRFINTETVRHIAPHITPGSPRSDGKSEPSLTTSLSESRASESAISDESLCNRNSVNFRSGEVNSEENVPTVDSSVKVPNSFKASLLQFSKSDGKKIEDGMKDKVLRSRNEKNITMPKFCDPNNSKTDPNKELLEKEADGRIIKTVILKKNGPLNFTVEGGINSDLAGKIIVSEVWVGSCVTEGGMIELGDQILMVDNTRLTGLSLTAANVALRNANSNANKEMTLVIAKAQQKSES